MIQREVSKMGDSLYIIIPKPVADLMDISVGTKIDLDYEKPKLIITKAGENIGLKEGVPA